MQDYEDNVIVYPPNKVLERNIHYSQIPTIHKSLMFLDFNSKKQAILGSSNVNGTLWEGITLFFQNTQDLEDLKWTGYYIGPTASDAKYLDDTTIVLAEETGNVQILNIDEKLKVEPYLVYQHFSRVPQLAVWSKSSKILTCSEKTINVIDTNNSKKLVFSDYHTELIYSVDTLKYNENCFVSCGDDRKVLTWDKRDFNTGSVLYTNEFATLTNVTWNQAKDEYIVCGTEGGAVYLLDRREPKTFVEVYHCFNNKINRLSHNPNSNQVAVCGDTSEIIVLDWNGEVFTKIYDNSEHQGIAKGLCWTENVLYSCGLDTKICKHTF